MKNQPARQRGSKGAVNSLFEAKETFFHCVMRRKATRDVVQINMKYRKNNRDVVLIGNHWPSRTAGAYESEPYRMMAGETLAYFHKRITDAALSENRGEHKDDEISH
ncbi:MAG: hypothetical protein EHM45_05815 [Desulfobacteraceae bacterium]|nr:MAG: hypothetical protein EHM45_05815 [Desulfobacteraceae bacterium]